MAPRKSLKQSTLSFPSPKKTPKKPAKKRLGRRNGSELSDIEDSEASASDVAAVRWEPKQANKSSGVISLSDASDEPSSPKPPSPLSRLRRTRPPSDEDKKSKSNLELVSTARRPTPKGQEKAFNSVQDPPPPSSSRKRKSRRGRRAATPEDTHVSADEVDEDRILESRFRTRDKKTSFQEGLERLKRKKMRLSSPEPDEEDEEDFSNTNLPFKGARPAPTIGVDNDEDLSSEADPDDDFIVADDPTQAAVELPTEFSSSSHQDLVNHFKVICQFMVHLAISPEDERHSLMDDVMKNNEYFSVPIQVARRTLSGLRDSLVASSVWRPAYKKPLETHPNLSISMLDFAVPACDACHIGGRVSTRLGRLSGEPYDKLGYSSLPAVSEDEEAEDSESNDEDVDIKEIKLKKEFHLGRFCARRTEVYHNFTHWEWMLFQALRFEVDSVRGTARGFIQISHGTKPPPELFKEDGTMDDTDLVKAADLIIDWLDQRGIVDREWQLIKAMMESARNLEMIAKRGGDQD